MPGVEAFISAEDIAGVNNASNGKNGVDEIFSTGRIHYAGQPIGLILADTYEHAQYVLVNSVFAISS